MSDLGVREGLLRDCNSALMICTGRLFTDIARSGCEVSGRESQVTRQVRVFEEEMSRKFSYHAFLSNFVGLLAGKGAPEGVRLRCKVCQPRCV